jgi:hypothetical protein
MEYGRPLDLTSEKALNMLREYGTLSDALGFGLEPKGHPVVRKVAAKGAKRSR